MFKDLTPIEIIHALDSIEDNEIIKGTFKSPMFDWWDIMINVMADTVCDGDDFAAAGYMSIKIQIRVAYDKQENTWKICTPYPKNLNSNTEPGIKIYLSDGGECVITGNGYEFMTDLFHQFTYDENGKLSFDNLPVLQYNYFKNGNSDGSSEPLKISIETCRIVDVLAGMIRRALNNKEDVKVKEVRSVIKETPNASAMYYIMLAGMKFAKYLQFVDYTTTEYDDEVFSFGYDTGLDVDVSSKGTPLMSMRLPLTINYEMYDHNGLIEINICFAVINGFSDIKFEFDFNTNGEIINVEDVQLAFNDFDEQSLCLINLSNKARELYKDIINGLEKSTGLNIPEKLKI